MAAPIDPCRGRSSMSRTPDAPIAGERRCDVRHAVSHVMHALAAALEELADRRIGPERLEQLDIGGSGRTVGDLQHRLPHSLRLVDLQAGDGQAER